MPAFIDHVKNFFGVPQEEVNVDPFSINEDLDAIEGVATKFKSDIAKNSDQVIEAEDKAAWKDARKQVWRNFKDFMTARLKHGKLFSRAAYSAIKLFMLFEPALSLAASSAYNHLMTADQIKTLSKELAESIQGLTPEQREDLENLTQKTIENRQEYLREHLVEKGIDPDAPEAVQKYLDENPGVKTMFNNKASANALLETGLAKALAEDRAPNNPNPKYHRLDAQGEGDANNIVPLIPGSFAGNTEAFRTLLKDTAISVGIKPELAQEYGDYYAASFAAKYTTNIAQHEANIQEARGTAVTDLNNAATKIDQVRTETLQNAITSVTSSLQQGADAENPLDWASLNDETKAERLKQTLLTLGRLPIQPQSAKDALDEQIHWLERPLYGLGNPDGLPDLTLEEVKAQLETLSTNQSLLDAAVLNQEQTQLINGTLTKENLRDDIPGNIDALKNDLASDNLLTPDLNAELNRIKIDLEIQERQSPLRGAVKDTLQEFDKNHKNDGAIYHRTAIRAENALQLKVETYGLTEEQLKTMNRDSIGQNAPGGVDVPGAGPGQGR